MSDVPVQADSGGSSAYDATSESDAGIPESQLRRLHPLTPLFRSWRAVGIAAAAGFGIFRDDLQKLEWIWHALHGDAELSVVLKGLLVVFVVAVVVAIGSWLSWRVTGFALVTDRSPTATLLFHRGLIVKQRRSVRLNRVQSVDVNQPFLPRLFGLGVVRLDMAAGDDASVDLAYLGIRDAWQVREEILPYTGAAPGTPGGPAAPASTETGSAASGAPAQTLIAEVSLPRLVQAALLEGIGELLLVVVWIVALVVAGAVWGWAGLAAGAAGIVPVTLAILVQLRKQVATVLRDANFRLFGTPTGIRISSGLTSTVNKTIDFDRIQGVRLQEPYLWRRLGWARVEVDVAGARRGESASLMPVADRREALGLIAEVTGEQIAAAALSPAGRGARTLDPWAYPRLGVTLLDRGAVTSTGRLRRTRFYVPYGRIQSVSARQGWIQRRCRVVTVYCDLPRGSTRWEALHRENTDALRLIGELVGRARAHRRPVESPSHSSVRKDPTLKRS